MHWYPQAPLRAFQACRMSFLKQTNKTPAASLKCCKRGMGILIHMQMQLICIDIDDYTILAINIVLYITHIALAIDPFLGLCLEWHTSQL